MQHQINESDKLSLIPYLDKLNEYNQQRIKDIEIRDAVADAYIQAKSSILKIQHPFSAKVESQLEVKLQQFNCAVEKIESFIENRLVANQALLCQNLSKNQTVEA